MKGEKKINLVTDSEGINNIKKLRLIFPEGGAQHAGTWILEKLGLVTVRFKSLSDMKNYVKPLVAEGIKLDELIIGSHGKGGSLLITRMNTPLKKKSDDSGDDVLYELDNDFLSIVKPLIIPNKTNVLFTACHGADELRFLKDAAEKLNTRVYGIAGISIPGLNKVLNLFEDKIYSCESRKVKGDINTMSSKDLLENFYCHTEMNHPINWLRVKK